MTQHQPDSPGSAVSVGEWKERKRAVRRPFPGPRGVDVPLRVAMERAAYADLSAHARESLDAEVCGVLIGETCEDDAGPFVHVRHIIRGTQAKERGTHVTYTQETWNQIHEVKERDFPNLDIVGWYHTHPGFGVEFSDMDRFIQRNFFPSPTQIGLVTDPLGGAVAVCMTQGDGIRYLSRFWVEGREQRCQVPAAQTAAGPAAGKQDLEALELRLSQLIQTVDDLRASLYRFLLTLGLLVGTALVVGLAYYVFASSARGARPPENVAFVPVSVKIDGKDCLIGVGVVKWQLPAELQTRPAEEKKREAPEEGGTP
jgi:proteasome lid subunit RPN8/RPN11